MIRVIVCDSDHGAAANVGGPISERFRTFDIDGGEAEAFLRAFDALDDMGKRYRICKVVGVELLPISAEARP